MGIKPFFFCIIASIASIAGGAEEQPPISSDETDEVYWETPQYLSRLETEKTVAKTQYVYHRRMNNFMGNWIIPLNTMPYVEGFSEIYKQAISKYQGREHLLTFVIPLLNCLWNDVIFLSPLHPHKHYEEYQKIGFTLKKVQFYKIPIEVLEEKRVAVWKWLSYKKYPKTDPIHRMSYSYCALNFSHYQEMDELPDDTKEFFRQEFDPKNPGSYPRYNWYRIPHILCQDSIDVSDERITVIDWEDPIEGSEN